MKIGVQHFEVKNKNVIFHYHAADYGSYEFNCSNGNANTKVSLNWEKRRSGL